MKQTKKLLRNVVVANLVICACVFARVGSPIPTGDKVESTTSAPKWAVDMEDQLFPAVILAMGTRRASAHANPMRLGEPNSMVGIKIESPTPNAYVRVSVSIRGLAAESIFDGTLVEGNRTYAAFPYMQFDAHALARLREAFPTTAVFSVSLNGVDLGQQTRPVQVRAVNDVPTLVRTPDGRHDPARFTEARPRPSVVRLRSESAS